MSQSLSEAEERLLAEVLAGDRMPDDPAVSAAASGNPAFADRLGELRGLVETLDAAATRERDLLAADPDPDAALEQLVAKTVKRLAAGPASNPPMPAPSVRKGPGPWLLALVAAACLAILWAVFRDPPRSNPNEDEQQLSGEKLVLQAPAVDNQGAITFSWKCTEPSATFEVLLYDPVVGDHRPLAESDELESNEWKIEANQARSLPPNTVWRVTARTMRGHFFSQERALR